MPRPRAATITPRGRRVARRDERGNPPPCLERPLVHPKPRARMRDRLRAAVVLCLASTAAPAQTMPNGVAAGDDSQTSAVLWARSTALGPITFECGDDPDLVSPEIAMWQNECDCDVDFYVARNTGHVVQFHDQANRVTMRILEWIAQL